jgi:hypothetical protein
MRQPNGLRSKTVGSSSDLKDCVRPRSEGQRTLIQHENLTQCKKTKFNRTKPNEQGRIRLKQLNQKGISLLEVVLSIVIVFIIFISFYQIFIHTNKTAVHQNEGLVLYNLANAELERLKITPIIFKQSTNDLSLQTQPGLTQLLTKEAENVWSYPSDFTSSNGSTYTVFIKRTPKIPETDPENDENRLNLLDVAIVVKSTSSKEEGVVEGYVSYNKVD